VFIWLKAGRLQIDGIEILPFYFCHIDIKINIKNCLKFAKVCEKLLKVGFSLNLNCSNG